MTEMIYPPDCPTEASRLALIDQSIGILRSGKATARQIEHLDRVMTDESRLQEKNSAVREKLFELRLAIDAHLPKETGFRKRRGPPPLPERAKRQAIREFRL